MCPAQHGRRTRRSHAVPVALRSCPDSTGSVPGISQPEHANAEVELSLCWSLSRVCCNALSVRVVCVAIRASAYPFLACTAESTPQVWTSVPQKEGGVMLMAVQRSRRGRIDGHRHMGKPHAGLQPLLHVHELRAGAGSAGARTSTSSRGCSRARRQGARRECRGG